MKVALIIGHSEGSQGARNASHNVSEFEFNGTLARLIRLHWKGTDLSLVHRDCSYGELPKKVNSLKPEVIVSLHCNGFNKRASGTETLHYQGSRLGKECAEAIQYHLVNALGLSDRGIKAKREEEKGGLLLKRTEAPCIIAEPFFIDNDSDYKIAWTNLDKLVDAYVMGLRRMLQIV